MATIWWTCGSAGIVIHQHWCLPIIANSRLVSAHVAVPRPREPAYLDMTRPSIRHRLRSLGTTNISRRPPQPLSEVRIVGERPGLFALEPTTTYVFHGVDLPKEIRFAEIFGKVLPLFDSLRVLGGIDIAGINQFVGIVLSIRGEG